MAIENDEVRTVERQEQISLLRRSIYAFSTTFACLMLIVAVLALGPPPLLGERIVSGAFELAGLMAMLYLGASVIDRTKLVDKVSLQFDQHGRRKKDDGDER